MDRVKEDVRADNMMEALQSALAGVPNGDFAAAAQDLLTALGYRSARTLLGQTGDVADFIAQFPAEKSCTVSEQTFRDEAPIPAPKSPQVARVVSAQILPVHPCKF